MEHVDEEQDKLRKYSYFMPNREFSGNMEDRKFKKIDDGTFTDNGYRWAIEPLSNLIITH